VDVSVTVAATKAWANDFFGGLLVLETTVVGEGGFTVEANSDCQSKAMAGQWRSQDFYKARAKKNLQYIYRDLHKKLQANNKKFKEIAQFIGVYIRNSRGFT
jgi:hypothetical protein